MPSRIAAYRDSAAVWKAIPSRMSCSLTTTSAAPIRSMIDSSTSAPAADHVHPARVHRPAIAARSAWVERSSHSVISRTLS